MAWKRHAKSIQKKKDICRIYIYIYIWKCIEHVWSTQSHPWHVISPGCLLSKGNRKSALLDWTNKWLYVSFICVRARNVHVTFASPFSRQKCCCRRLPESGALLIPAGFTTPKRNTGARTHTRAGVHAYLRTSVTTDHRLAYFTS